MANPTRELEASYIKIHPLVSQTRSAISTVHLFYTYIYGVVVLKELLTKDKVKTVASAEVADQTVVGTSITTPVGNLILGQNVLTGCQGKRLASNSEYNVLEARVAAGRDNHQACGGVCVGSFDVLVKDFESTGLKVNESGSSINDTRQAGRDRCGAIGDL